MADLRANTEITILVEPEAETGNKREDPGRSRKVEKAVEEHRMVGSTETPTGNRKMKDIEGFKQRYIDDMESYFGDLEKSPEAVSRGSGFYRIHRNHRQGPEGSDQDLYAPTWANFRDTRKMLMEHNPSDDTKKRLRHYYHHLKSVLVRNPKNTLEYFLLMMNGKEKDLTTWCAVEKETPTDFPQLLGLVLSGFFIADLFYKCYWDDFSPNEDPEFCHKWASDLWVDLLLVENQIPLFILQDVINSWSTQDDISSLTLEKLVYYYFKDFIPLQKQPSYREISEGSNEPSQFLHLLHMVHQCLLPDRKSSSFGILIRFVGITAPLLVCITAPLVCIFICLACIYILLKKLFNALVRLCQASPPTQDTNCLQKFVEGTRKRILELLERYFYKYFRKPQVLLASIPTASRLQQAGVQFRPVEGKGFVVDFSKGILRLPRLHVRKNTKKFLANLIAWEQYHHEAVKYFINYAVFMDYLVNNSKDIEILIQNRVLEHSLATDEDVAAVFNTLGKDLCYTKNEGNREDYDFLPQLSKELDRYCQSRFNVWRAHLMSNYFKSPWTIISLIAAILIVVSTMIQTFFSVYSYFRPPK